MLRIYFYTLALVAYLAAVVGLAAPALVSMKDTTAVVAGFVLLTVVSPVVGYLYFKAITRHMAKERK